MRQQGGISSVTRPEVVEIAQKKLGAARSAAVWADGQSMTVADAVALCLSDVADDSPPLAQLANVQRSRLTDRELEVIRLIANGKSNREIALVLVLSTRTVERHIENLYAKIGVDGRADATAYAIRLGLA
jgi:DNA-binding NarL/FixJ family response regulator